MGATEAPRFGYDPEVPYKNGDTFLTEEQIADIVRELAKQMAPHLRGQKAILVPILKAADVFAADLGRALDDEGVEDAEKVFIQLRSRKGDNTQDEKMEVVKGFEINDVSGKVVAIIDTIDDSGLTGAEAVELAELAGAKTVYSVALLDKDVPKIVKHRPDFTGRKVPNLWFFGYGTDDGQLYRTLRVIKVKIPETAQTSQISPA